MSRSLFKKFNRQNIVKFKLTTGNNSCSEFKLKIINKVYLLQKGRAGTFGNNGSNLIINKSWARYLLSTY